MPGQPRQDDPREAVITRLVEELRRFTVETDVFVDVFARAHGLGRNDLNAIMWISEGTTSGQPVTIGELAGRLGLGPPATTALVDRLEAAGHVHRAPDPQDRRRVIVRMEDRAMQLALAFFLPLGRTMRASLEPYPAEHLEAAAAVVTDLTAAVVTARRSVMDRPAP